MRRIRKSCADRYATTGEKRARDLVRADVFKKNALKEKLIKEYASCVPMDHDCETKDELPLCESDISVPKWTPQHL